MEVIAMTRHPALAALVALTLAGCVDPTGPDDPFPFLTDDPLPALTHIDYAALQGQRIAFHRGTNDVHGLYIADGVSGTATGHLGGSAITNPRLSPDGGRVAFNALSGFETFWDVHTSRLDGSSVVSVAAQDGNSEGPPEWSPDGADVLFECCFPAQVKRAPAGGGSTTIPWTAPAGDVPHGRSQVAMAANGTIAVVDLTGIYVTGVGLAYEPPTAPSRRPWPKAPVWSSDGASLYFVEVSYDGDDYARTTVYRLDPATGVTTPLGAVDDPAVNLGFFGGQEGYSACRSPGDELLIFTAPVGEGFSIFAIPLTGGAPVRVTSPEDGSDTSVSCL